MSSTASATPTSIPHCERSSHHHSTSDDQQLLPPINTNTFSSLSSSSSFSGSPPLVSPLYAGANRVFAASTSPTQSRWAGGTSGSLNSRPQQAAQSASSPKVEKEYFDGPWGSNGIKSDTTDSNSSSIGHHRRATSGSISSSLSSLGTSASGGEPTTPRETSSNSTLTNGMQPLGRVPSLPLGSNGSYEAAQKRLSGSGTGGWGSLSGFKNKGAGSPTEKNNGGMGGLLRSFSISRSNGPSSPPLASQPISSPTFSNAVATSVGSPPSPSNTGQAAINQSAQQQPLGIEGRGRKPSVGQGGKRRPSPVSVGSRSTLLHRNGIGGSILKDWGLQEVGSVRFAVETGLRC